MNATVQLDRTPAADRCQGTELARTGHRWSPGAITTIVKNEAYTGALVWGRRSVTEAVKVEDAWTPIIDRETFAAANAGSENP